MKIILINKNKFFIFTIFYIVLLSLKNLNNCQKLIIINLITSFIRNQIFLEEYIIRYYWPKLIN